MTRWMHVVVAAAILALPVALHAGERAAADVSCTPTDQKFVYDCMIMLKGKKSGTPMTDAKIVIHADMPSMPRAHTVRPVTAMPMGMPGQYHAKVELEMHGDWALTLEVSGPIRDKLVMKLRFGEGGDHAGHMMQGGMEGAREGG